MEMDSLNIFYFQIIVNFSSGQIYMWAEEISNRFWIMYGSKVNTKLYTMDIKKFNLLA